MILSEEDEEYTYDLEWAALCPAVRAVKVVVDWYRKTYRRKVGRGHSSSSAGMPEDSSTWRR